jgi:hypothetical protein
MRRVGLILLSAGALVGIASGVWTFVGPAAGGLSWLVGVGLIKLTFAAGLGLMAGGAVSLRIANRREARALPPGK